MPDVSQGAGKTRVWLAFVQEGACLSLLPAQGRGALAEVYVLEGRGALVQQDSSLAKQCLVQQDSSLAEQCLVQQGSSLAEQRRQALLDCQADGAEGVLADTCR